eukprot:jgi/Psemu1/286368/fgenesh1_pg.131_\
MDRYLRGILIITDRRYRQDKEHEGNQQFSKLIQDSFDEYEETESERSSMIFEVIDAVSGRFWQRPKGGEGLVVMSEKDIRDTISRRFRDIRNARKRQEKKESPAPDKPEMVTD